MQSSVARLSPRVAVAPTEGPATLYYFAAIVKLASADPPAFTVIF
jgi:hypothetical protein